MKLKIVHKSYSYVPQTKEELREIIAKRLEKNNNADLNDIDVSNITDMSYLFDGLDPHNIDISDWMYRMYKLCVECFLDVNN